MLEMFVSDIVENDLLQLEKSILTILLFDRTSRRNIIWATDDYATLGADQLRENICLPLIVRTEGNR